MKVLPPFKKGVGNVFGRSAKNTRNLYLEDGGMPGKDGGLTTRGPTLVAAQPGPLPHHLSQGTSAPAIGKEPGWGCADPSTDARSLPITCYEQPGLGGMQQGSV